MLFGFTGIKVAPQLGVEPSYSVSETDALPLGYWGIGGPGGT